MKSTLASVFKFEGNMSLDTSAAREMENEVLGEHSSDLAEAFRAITTLVVD